ERNASKISSCADEKNYAAASRTYAEFYDPIHDFFDKVLVNDKNLEIRANRQALMKKINELYTEKIADLSLITNQ
ncbi:MAG: glycine--tRNA ligase subunit beta, partial [Candidatus Omnitrophica bacterium]|nr:glycine--tRNA ligase subunit beta [Candidatus Omnitrophota bacterium]